MKDPRQFLAETLSERMATNPGYSLRAFARDLELAPQSLSNVINGRRGLSDRMAIRISQKLGLTEIETELFCQSSKATFSKSRAMSAVAKAKIIHLQKSSGVTKNLELDLFKAVSNWHYFALVELIKIGKHKSRHNAIQWFASKLGIAENEVKVALSRLERLELISQTEASWKVNQDAVVADQGVPTEAVRNFHRQILDKAARALAMQSQGERYGSSSTLPIRVKNVPRAKKLIQEFREKFNRELTDHKHGEEVYGFSVQFFRLTEILEADL